MFMDDIKKEMKWIIFVIAYMILTAISGTLLNDGLVMFLTINMFLAGVAYILTYVVIYVKEKYKKKWLLVLATGLWIIFYPNMIYITSDLIHLQNYSFFEIYGQSYAYQISNWYILFIILLGTVLSASLGMRSIDKMLNVWKIEKYQFYFISILFILSSIGIYIGRFIRLNSWQIYRLDIIFREIVFQFPFFIGFITIFTSIHFIYYFISHKKHV